MVVRRATGEDIETMAEIIAVVAEEGSLGAEPPVDLQRWADRFREMLTAAAGNAVWVLERVLATCSCTGLVDRTMFLDILGQVSERSGRPIRILEQRGQGSDHPVSASCLETEYLKCLVARVS